jgi:UDP-glucose:(heptosyl)LPS alpha-1,3-glucosyltransferase
MRIRTLIIWWLYFSRILGGYARSDWVQKIMRPARRQSFLILPLNHSARRLKRSPRTGTSAPHCKTGVLAHCLPPLPSVSSEELCPNAGGYRLAYNDELAIKLYARQYTRTRMNIGLVRRGYSRTGGAENYLDRLGRALVDRGFGAKLYTTEEWPEAEWPYGTLVRFKASTPWMFAQEIQQRQAAGEILFSLDRVFACDCYRAGDGVHRIWLERRIAHEPAWRSRFRFLNPKHRQILELERKLFEGGGAKRVIANSKLVKNEIVREFGYPQQNIVVIYNGLPHHFRTKPQSRPELRRDWRLRDEEIALLFAGSGWDRKGLNYAIEAIQRTGNVNIRLLVAGSGTKPVSVPKYVRFLGPVADMQSLYAASDLFILPTIYDPFSNACLEALSFGIPVITTASNGLAEIIQSGIHGEIIDSPNDIGAIKRAVEEWADPDRRETAKESCLSLARQFSMDRNVEQTLEVLEGLAG